MAFLPFKYMTQLYRFYKLKHFSQKILPLERGHKRKVTQSVRLSTLVLCVKKKIETLQSRTWDAKNSTCVPNTQNCGYSVLGNTKAKYSRMVMGGGSQ
jgi:hypothetical protein